MLDNVIKLRFRGGSDNYIEDWGGYDLRCRIADPCKIEEALNHYFEDLKDIGNRDIEPSGKVLESTRDLQASCFPYPSEFVTLSQVIINSHAGTTIRINVEPNHETMLLMPWELFCHDPNITQMRPDNLWGTNHVFQRTHSQIHGNTGMPPPASNIPSFGLVTFRGIPNLDEIQTQLNRLHGEDRLRFKGSPTARIDYRRGDLPELMTFLGDLEVAHLGCLIIRLLYTNRSYFVFSDEFLVSIADMSEHLKFGRNRLVLLDACDNTWHLMSDRLKFMKQLIRCGSANIITSFYPIPRTLVTRFVQYFYDELVAQPDSVHNALMQARRKLLVDTANPLFLLFWLYGDPYKPIRGSQQNARADQIEINRQLRDVLADLYPDQASAAVIAEDAGLDVKRIQTDPKISNYWHAILKEAALQGAMDNILRLASRNYPNYKALQEVSQLYNVGHL